MIFHIGGGGLHVSDGPDGPWRPVKFFGCNNPAPAFHPNGTAFVVCHNNGYSMCGGCQRSSFLALSCSPQRFILL